jgi:hypothetical protein
LIAWHQPLTSSSKWNTDALILLAEKAQESLGAKYDSSWLLLPELVKQIIVCLKDTKSIMHPAVGPPSLKAPVEAARTRRRARKQMVRYFVSVV